MLKRLSSLGIICAAGQFVGSFHGVGVQIGHADYGYISLAF